MRVKFNMAHSNSHHEYGFEYYTIFEAQSDKIIEYMCLREFKFLFCGTPNVNVPNVNNLLL